MSSKLQHHRALVTKYSAQITDLYNNDGDIDPPEYRVHVLLNLADATAAALARELGVYTTGAVLVMRLDRLRLASAYRLLQQAKWGETAGAEADALISSKRGDGDLFVIDGSGCSAFGLPLAHLRLVG